MSSQTKIVKRNPELNYKQLRALVTFQKIFKMKKRTIYELNNTIDSIYNTLLSLSNNLNNNYQNHIIDESSYYDLMSKADDLMEIYEGIKIRYPLNLKSLKSKELIHKISFLHYKTARLVEECGASSCLDILELFGGSDWDIDLSTKNLKMIKLLNTMFVPVSVRTSILNLNPNSEIRVSKHLNLKHFSSLTMKIHGAEITIPIHGKNFAIYGYFRDDQLNISRIQGKLSEKLESIYKNYDTITPVLEKYIGQISLRNFLCCDVETLVGTINRDLEHLQKIKTEPKGYVLEEFLGSSPNEQYKFLTLFLIDEETHEYVSSLLRIEMINLDEIYKNLHWSIKKIFNQVARKQKKSSIGFDMEQSIVPYNIRIKNMKCSDIIRKKALDKLKEIETSKDSNEKATQYLDGLLRIPFGNYRKEKIISFIDNIKTEISDLKTFISEMDTPGELLNIIKENKYQNEYQIDKLFDLLTSLFLENSYDEIVHGKIKVLSYKWEQFKIDRRNYINNISDTLEDCIYGQEKAKRNIASIIAQWINGEMTGVVFGFQGYPGTGKTTLAKFGIANCLKDEDGKSRPFYFTRLGGAHGSSYLLGHGYTYVGSQPGKLAEYVQDAKIMNPILYFDELDKVSNTPQGEEIIRVLTHLLDPEQNNHIEDRYFGVEMDLSKALIILSYNDSSCIDSILMDRIHEIKFKQYNTQDKIIISKNYLLKKICESHGFSHDNLIISDDNLKYIIDNYTCEAGVRDIKEKLTVLVREINLRRIYDEDNYRLPFNVTKELVDDILESENKLFITKIPSKPQTGWVNGLYATNIGTGGITIIEVYNTPSDQKYTLELTGKLGDVMKESVICAKTNSWSLFNNTPMFDDINKQWRENALHVHFPAAGTSKDGPSAGLAITTAIVSYLSNMPFRNYVAMTGEIDLHGNACPIGGLQCKIEGAVRAGVKIVLIPKKNEPEYLLFKDKYDISVFAVDNISQVIRTCIIGASDDTFNYKHNITEDIVVKKILNCIDNL
jgi:ATP-dependent Lon protease